MKKQVLFVHGGGQGAYEEDKKLAANLRDALGAACDVRYPKMPDEDSPEYEAWKDQIARELAALDGEVILVGHSLGAVGNAEKRIRGNNISRAIPAFLAV
jgi:uncharacterized protein